MLLTSHNNNIRRYFHGLKTEPYIIYGGVEGENCFGFVRQEFQYLMEDYYGRICLMIKYNLCGRCN